MCLLVNIAFGEVADILEPSDIKGCLKAFDAMKKSVVVGLLFEVLRWWSL